MIIIELQEVNINLVIFLSINSNLETYPQFDPHNQNNILGGITSALELLIQIAISLLAFFDRHKTLFR